jgi:hypothetical protein
MVFKCDVDLLGPILGPKADMYLLMSLHGVLRIISAARLDEMDVLLVA